MALFMAPISLNKHFKYNNIHKVPEKSATNFRNQVPSTNYQGANRHYKLLVIKGFNQISIIDMDKLKVQI